MVGFVSQHYLTLPPPDWKLSDLLFGLYYSITRKDSIQGLEGTLRSLLGVSHVMVTNLGRTAITIGLKAAGVEDGAGVILPTIVCPSVIKAVLNAGCHPILADVESNLHISVRTLSLCPFEKAKAVLVPHLYGLSAPVQEIKEWTKERDLILIDDAAQAVGISTNGKYLGTFGDFGILSFGPFKSLSTVRGGALISENGDLVKKAKEYVFPNEGIYWPIRRVLGSIMKFHLRPYHLRINRKLNHGLIKANSLYNELNPVGITDEAFQLSNLEAQLVRSALRRAATVISGRRKAAHEIWKLMRQFNKFEFVASDITSHAKIPIRSCAELTAEHAVRTFRSLNIEAEQIYYPLHLYRKYAHYASQPLRLGEENWKRVFLIPNPGADAIFGIDRLGQAFKTLSNKV